MSDEWRPPLPPRPPKPPKPPLPPPPAPTPTPAPTPGPTPAPAPRRFTFESEARGPGGQPFTFEVIRLNGEEGISQLYRFELILMSESADLPLATVLNARATLTLHPPNRGDGGAPYHGRLAEFEQLQQANDRRYFYRAVLVPALWDLSLFRRSDIHLGKTVPEILKIVLEAGGLKEQPAPVQGGASDASLPAGFALKLKEVTWNYPAHDFVCQYQESPLAFLSRWLEREGLYYYFEHAKGRTSEQLVLLDDVISQQGNFSATYVSADRYNTGIGTDSVQAFVCRVRPVTADIELRDFEPAAAGTAPQHHEYLGSNGSDSASRSGREMRYGDHFPVPPPLKPGLLGRTVSVGDRYARVRAQELARDACVFYGEATAVGLRSGEFMTLSGHFRTDLNDRKYLVTQITHEGWQSDLVASGVRIPGEPLGARRETAYRNTFVALPAEVQYRPSLRTPWPSIAGTMSATIDGGAEATARARADAEKVAKDAGHAAADVKAAGDNAVKGVQLQYADLTERGYYWVRLPFDAGPRATNKASAPIRLATPYAGDGHGLHFPLHKGTEVLLSFMGGDPDRPVIVGAVPNSVNLNVVTADNKTKNRLLTHGGNEIVLDDKKDAQAIWLYSPPSKSLIGIGHPAGPETSKAPANETAAQKTEREASDAKEASDYKGQSQGYKVKGDTGILLATAGKIQQVQQESEASFWGSSFSAKVGNSISASASFDTKISWGASVGISGSTDVKWAMDMLPSPVSMASLDVPSDWKKTKKLSKLLKANSVSISDSSSVKFSKKSDGLVAVDGVSLVAGGKPDEKWWTVNAYERVIKVATAAYVTSVLAYQKVCSADVEKLAAKGGDYKGLNAIQPLHTVAFIAGLQAWARQMASKLADLTLASRVEVDKEGVRLAVNAPERKDALTATAASDPRSEVNVNADGSLELHSAASSDWQKEDAAAASVLNLAGGQMRVYAGEALALESPQLNLGPSDGSGVKLVLSKLDGMAEIKTPHSYLVLDADGLTGIGPKVMVGTGQVIPNPQIAILAAQSDIAHAAWLKLRQATAKAMVEAETADDAAKPGLALLAAAAQSAEQPAQMAYLKSLKLLRETKASLGGKVLVGLTVDQTSASIAGGGGSVKTSPSGVSLAFGASALVVNAQGLEHSGLLIKIG